MWYFSIIKCVKMSIWKNADEHSIVATCHPRVTNWHFLNNNQMAEGHSKVATSHPRVTLWHLYTNNHMAEVHSKVGTSHPRVTLDHVVPLICPSIPPDWHLLLYINSANIKINQNNNCH